MNGRIVLILGFLVLLIGVQACSDDQGIALGDTGTGTTDTGSDVTTDGTDDTGADAVADAVDIPVGPTFESMFSECESNEECDEDDEIDGDEVCHENVCVKAPIAEAALYRDQDNSYVPLDEEPNLSCWVTPIELGEGPATTSIGGSVDLFGPESPTRNLCVTAYDQELFMLWSWWLAQEVCEEQRDVDLRTQEPFVNCFALDPCRCDDEDFTVNRGDAGDSVEACYAEIGFCSALDDYPALQTQCRQNILDRTGIEADTIIHDSVKSTPHPDNPDRTEGVYEMEGIPTNSLIVLKVSGTMRRWRDTYEFNALMRADGVDDDGHYRWDGNVITEGAWRTIPQSAGMADPLEADATAIAGIVRDCGTDEREPELVEGVRVGFVIDPETIAYFNGVSSDTMPLPGRAYTNTDGVYAALGAPSGPNRVSLVTLQDGEPVSAGVRDVFGMPFSVIIATFEGNFAVE